MPVETTNIVQRRRARRADQRRAGSSRWRMGGVSLGIFISFLLVLLILAAALAYANLTSNLPNVDLLPVLLNPPDGLLLQPTRVYDRTGQNLLMTFAPNDSPRRYIPLNPQSPQHLPDFLAKATVAVADPGFWNHGGYLLSGLNDPESHPTIAEKLVSDLLLYKEPPSLRRALRERILAAQITAKFGRTQILEWYLNSADYGNYAFGADAAAQLYFGKPAYELTPAESALLAATSQSPSLNPFDAKDIALQRGRTTIQLMQALNLISSDEAKQALAQTPSPLTPLPNSGEGKIAPAFLNLVINQLGSQFTRERIERGGLNITTTLDFDLQQQATCATLTYAARLAGAADPTTPCSAADLLPSLPPNTNVKEPSASALIYDPQTGQILAAVGETLRGGQTAFLSAHDPGSLMTPFIYLTAFTRGLSPASMVWDVPTKNVQNFDGQYHGPVRIRIALNNDYLVPARSVADQMGADVVQRTESSFGLSQSDSTLLDMATAYGIFAAQGVRYGQPGPSAVLRVEGLDHSLWLDLTNPQAQPVVAPQLAYLMNNVLSDEPARWPSLGHPNDLEIGRPAGAKIGQTDSGLNAWTVGYTPSRVVAVWTGTHATDSPRLSPKLPAGLWNALMQLATQSLPADGWSMPAGITTMDVCDPSGLLPTKDCPSVVSEVFLNGNEPVQADNLFRSFEINRETGYLATVFTPPQLVEDKVFMIVPPDEQAWAKSANIPMPPTSYDAIQAAPVNPDVHISSPAMFANVSGQVQFIGTASGTDFDHYRVLVGQGLNPQQWIQIGNDSTTPISDGTLATWNTTGLNGLYAVQLQVIRTDQRVDSAIIQVTVSDQ
ncbi:MAG: transglycosylase domain-containing protein [Chloroflexi bacterium]|nr:transglycosylase domain-containing protein [Chloroflexota bacterium]